MLTGAPHYDQMTPSEANVTRQWLPHITPLLTALGEMKSFRFKGVDQNGADIYQVKFEQAITDWRIIMAPDERIYSLSLNAVQ